MDSTVLFFDVLIMIFVCTFPIVYQILFETSVFKDFLYDVLDLTNMVILDDGNF